MEFNLEKEIVNITQQIIEKYKPEKIILFGSAARGEWTSDSGADFLIIKKETPLYGSDRVSIPRQSRGLYDCWPLKGA